MSSRVELQGFEDLKAALRALPSALAQEAIQIVEHTVATTASQLRQSYPSRDTGNLRKGVKEKIEKGEFGVSGVVRSTSPHSHLWEFGTQNRQTRRGWRRGRAPQHKAEGLVPIAKRERKRMNAGLMDVVKRAGFEVTGSLDG